MRIQMVHVRNRRISFAIFLADAANHTDTGRQALLAERVARARGNRLRLDKDTLAYQEAGRTRFVGTPDLVEYLASRGVPRWTHRLDV